MRPKLTIPAQIKDMKEAGITFNVMSEIEAARYLDESSYYFRIKAYAKNYEKYVGTDKEGQYINLDFAYLVDLFEIDTSFKKIIIDMSFDVERFLIVKMLSDFQKVDEDGYDIINDFFMMLPSLHDSIEEKVKAPLCTGLITRYRDEWSIWNIVEVLTLGQLTILYGLFYTRNKFKDSYTSLVLPMNMIRNAASHNNCLINRLRPPYRECVSLCYELRNELSQHTSMSSTLIEKRLAHTAIHDFYALLYLFSRVVPVNLLERSYTNLRDLFYCRIPKNKEFYNKNEPLRNCYDFVLKIIDFYIDK